MTESFDRPSGANNATGMSIEGNRVPQAVAGATGAKTATASGNADVGNTHILALRRLNASPTVSLTSPANGATFAAPAAVTLSATATDADGTITKVEFFQGTSLINTDTVSPYSFNWTGVPAGGYTLTAKATDNLGAVTTSIPVSITVTAPAATLYFIHPDHLNTPRVITNPSQQVVWRWDNSDAFGTNMANENPGGLGVFTSNLRFPGQYFDLETNLHYNYYRDYSPEIGRYVQSDPIVLTGGINTYTYVGSSPLSYVDARGLAKNPPICFNPRECVDPPIDPPNPKNPSKPSGYDCVNVEPSFAACLQCCASRSPAQYTQKPGSTCSEQCYRAWGITQASPVNICSVR